MKWNTRGPFGERKEEENTPAEHPALQLKPSGCVSRTVTAATGTDSALQRGCCTQKESLVKELVVVVGTMYSGRSISSVHSNTAHFYIYIDVAFYAQCHIFLCCHV